MKKISILAVVLSLVAMTVSFAELPLDFSLSTEAETHDILGDGDSTLELTTGLEAVLGETGFSFGLELGSLLSPDVILLGTLEVSEAYAFAYSGVDFEVSNANTLYLESEADTDGTIALDATWKFINGGVEFQYMPDSELKVYAGPTYTKELGPGTLDLSATVDYLITPDAMLGNIEGTVQYTLPVGPAEVFFGLYPTLNEVAEERELGCSVFAGASIDF